MKIRFYHICIFLSITWIFPGCEQEEDKLLSPSLSAGATSEVSAVNFTAHWKPFPLVDYYLLDVGLDPDFEERPDTLYPLSVSDTFQLVKNLQPETSYFFRVAAYTKSGTFIEYSPTTNIITARLSSPRAYEPMDINIKQIYTGWNPVQEADGYQLQLAEDINFERIVRTYNKTGVQDTLQLMDSLQSNQPYFYRVRAKKEGFYSDYSNIIYTNTTDLAKPHLKAPSELSYTSLALEWDAVEYATSYRLEVSTEPLFLDEQALEYSLELAATKLVLPELQPNTVYYGRVRARQGALYSLYSDVVQFRTLALAKPETPTVSEVGADYFTVGWNRIVDAETYEIDLATDRYFRTILPRYNGYPVVGEGLTLTSLQPGTSYYLRLRSYGLSSYSDYSDTLEVFTLPLGAPAGLTTSDRKLDQFTLNWPEVAGAESYLLDVATDSDFAHILDVYDQKEVFQSEIVINQLAIDQTYYVRLKSKYENIVSIASEVLTVPAAVPAACVLAARSWDDQWSERYYYSQGLLTVIEGDSASLNTTTYRWELHWDNGFLIKAERYDADAGGNLVLSAVWEYAYQQGVWTALHRKDALLNTLELIQLSYNINGTLSSISSFADAAASTLNFQESYSYENNQIIEALNGANELVRAWKYASYFNPESLIPTEAHALLRDPEGTHIIGYIPQEAVNVYDWAETNGLLRHAFVYETNSLDMPQKVYSGDVTSTQTFTFQLCGF